MGKVRPNKIRELRDARGWTARELGERAGLWHTQIYRYESGEIEPELTNAQKLARALGVSVEDLFPVVEPEEASA